MTYCRTLLSITLKRLTIIASLSDEEQVGGGGGVPHRTRMVLPTAESREMKVRNNLRVSRINLLGRRLAHARALNTQQKMIRLIKSPMNEVRPVAAATSQKLEVIER